MDINLLAKMQQELKAPKNQFNDFGKYAYRSCEDILKAVKSIMSDHDATLILTDEIVQLGDRFYIKATATLKDGKNEYSAIGYAREPENKKGMDESQITGTASSYARKYALNGLFCIDDTKDADSNEHKEQVDNTPNWYNDFDKQKETMIKKIESGEQTPDGIIEALKRAGFALSKKTMQQIKDLAKCNYTK